LEGKVRKVTTLFMAVLLTAGLFAQDRFALIIGNSDYIELGSLENPVNDATDMASVLGQLGYDVSLVLNGDLVQMETALINYGRKLSTSREAKGIFYYAGHGVQSGGDNYLIPSGAQIGSEAFLRSKALSTESITSILEQAGNEVNVMILDACRDNPFGWSRGGTRGLSVVSRSVPGIITVFATAPGAVALDGEGRNGVFTGELLKHIAEPGLEIMEVLDRTGQAVLDSTGGKQFPEVKKQYFGKFYVSGDAPAVTTTTTTTTTVTPAVTPSVATTHQTNTDLDNTELAALQSKLNTLEIRLGNVSEVRAAWEPWIMGSYIAGGTGLTAGTVGWLGALGALDDYNRDDISSIKIQEYRENYIMANNVAQVGFALGLTGGITGLVLQLLAPDEASIRQEIAEIKLLIAGY
jgi:hypothetical protein